MQEPPELRGATVHCCLPFDLRPPECSRSPYPYAYRLTPSLRSCVGSWFTTVYRLTYGLRSAADPQAPNAYRLAFELLTDSVASNPNVEVSLLAMR